MDFNSLLMLVQSYGYFFLFLLMFLEGPIVTYLAAFLSSLGYFNPLYIFLISAAGNFLPDFVYYAIGRSMRKKVIYSYLIKKRGFSQEKIDRIIKQLRLHAGKMLIIIKIVPPLPPIGLTLSGMVLPFKKFALLSVTISAVYSLFFFAAGFYSGSAYSYVTTHFKALQFIFFGLVVLLVGAYYLFMRWMEKKEKSYINL
ncbi:MAG: VTT domain-containing protein [archaeon]